MFSSTLLNSLDCHTHWLVELFTTETAMSSCCATNQLSSDTFWFTGILRTCNDNNKNSIQAQIKKCIKTHTPCFPIQNLIRMWGKQRGSSNGGHIAYRYLHVCVCLYLCLYILRIYVSLPLHHHSRQLSAQLAARQTTNYAHTHTRTNLQWTHTYTHSCELIRPYTCAYTYALDAFSVFGKTTQSLSPSSPAAAAADVFAPWHMLWRECNRKKQNYFPIWFCTRHT